MKRQSTTGKKTSKKSKKPTTKSLWPSVEAQIAADNIFQGSALEKLIRDNQDFRILRPEEANDRIGLPPWLRVYWRKHHPEARYSGADPTGGYPRALRRLYAWMIMNQDAAPNAR